MILFDSSEKRGENHTITRPNGRELFPIGHKYGLTFDPFDFRRGLNRGTSAGNEGFAPCCRFYPAFFGSRLSGHFCRLTYIAMPCIVALC